MIVLKMVSGDKNIVTIEAANYAAFIVMISFPTNDKNFVTYSI
ncbi:hypothetical protein SAMN05661091_3084 [Paenibacillus uliginis N3/975]|uniref:Uncharacterized protein n=1 Tax=Paenibacillus uliginis N3/975 TaxID=1313296 RepID=A0A1X7HFH0_9BACL|nr:hypothetical protein SAMN05661091_3084 [Paenibacillus uliginis N3/975]